MRRQRRPAGLAAAMCAAVAMLLATGGSASADLGTAGFTPSSAAPGDTVVVGLDGCTEEAADVRIALARMSRTGELAGADEGVDVAARDGGTPGEYLVVVPELDPGLYGVLAACPRDGAFGFWGSEEYLDVLGTPDTATLAPVARPPADAGRWRGLALLASAVLAIAAWGKGRRRPGRHGG